MNNFLKILLIGLFLSFGSAIKAQLSTHFVITWDIPSPMNVVIPHNPGYTYLYDVDWDNDGVFIASNSGYTGSAGHFFPAGAHTVRVRGTFPAIFFDNTGDKDYIVSVDQWGDIEWKSMKKALYSPRNQNCRYE